MPLRAAFAPVVADEEAPINPKTLPQPGFVIKTYAMADSQKWFVNCCAHEIVDRPLGNGSKEQVDDAYLDAWCLSNVQVPLHVCSRRSTTDHAGETSTAIDVIFNPALTQRATAGNKNSPAFLEHMANLALSHAEREYGVKLDRKHKVIRAVYKGGRGDGSAPLPVPELVELERQQIADALAGGRAPAGAGGRGGGGAAQPAKKLVQEFDSWEAAEQAARAPKAAPAPAQRAARPAAAGDVGVGAAAATTTVKKGFLNGAGGKLYPNGSSEGTPAPGAGDPLGWMPEKLRARVQTVDTNTTSAEEQQRLMRVHAGLEEDPQKKERRLAREKADEERKAWAAVQQALPSKEELDRIARETDPDDFLNELRAVSENMARLERPVAAHAGDDGGASFAKKGFLTVDGGGSAAGAQPRASPARTPSVAPEFVLRGEADGAEVGSLELLVKLPTIAAIGDLELDISDEMVLLRGPGDIELRLVLPHKIVDGSCVAKFSKKKRELRLLMPVARPS